MQKQDDVNSLTIHFTTTAKKRTNKTHFFLIVLKSGAFSIIETGKNKIEREREREKNVHLQKVVWRRLIETYARLYWIPKLLNAVISINSLVNFILWIYRTYILIVNLWRQCNVCCSVVWLCSANRGTCLMPFDIHIWIAHTRTQHLNWNRDSDVCVCVCVFNTHSLKNVQSLEHFSVIKCTRSLSSVCLPNESII